MLLQGLGQRHNLRGDPARNGSKAEQPTMPQPRKRTAAQTQEQHRALPKPTAEEPPLIDGYRCVQICVIIAFAPLWYMLAHWFITDGAIDGECSREVVAD